MVTALRLFLVSEVVGHPSLAYKIVMDDGPDTKMLARLAHLYLAGPGYMASRLQIPKRSITLRQGAWTRSLSR
jgi:hypothetical protein